MKMLLRLMPLCLCFISCDSGGGSLALESAAASSEASVPEPEGVDYGSVAMPHTRNDDEDFMVAFDRWSKELGIATVDTDMLSDQDNTNGTNVSASDAELSLVQALTIPNYTKEELNTAFRTVRDLKMFSDPEGNKRRLTWLFPGDGCYARASLMGYILENKGYQRPMKVFTLGNLRAATDNHPKGYVAWGYHVAPIVRVGNTAYVLDPSLDPAKPLTLEQWKGLQTYGKGRIAKTKICSEHAFTPSQRCHETRNFDKTAFNTIKNKFLDKEWDRQEDLGRDPNKVLGPKPPWAP